MAELYAPRFASCRVVGAGSPLAVDFAALTNLLAESGATSKALHLVGAPAPLRSADAISQREG
jgi:hypothetical protein